MSVFVEYKKYLGKIKSQLDSELIQMNKDLDYINGILNDWEHITINDDPKKMTFRLKIIKKFMPDIYREAHKKKLTSDRDSLKEIIKDMQDLISLVKRLTTAFDNERAKLVIDEISFILYTLCHATIDGVIDEVGATQIFGSIMVFNSKHPRKSTYNNSLKPVTAKIASIFNSNGEFIGNDEISLDELIKTIVDWERDFKKGYYIDIDENRSQIDHMIKSINQEYEKYLSSLPEVEEEPKKVKAIDYSKLEELHKYYKNGELILVPGDLVKFENLLNDCGIDDQEKRYIYSLIYKKLSIKTPSIPNDDKRTFDTGIAHNLLFLLNKDGQSYFDNDLDEFDKGIKKKAISLLNKINSNNPSNFNIVKVNGENTRLLQTYNDVFQIIFKELTPGIYLIIGLNQIRRDNTRLINRFYLEENQEFLREIMTALGNDDERLKLLTKHASFMPVMNKKTILNREKPSAN